MEIAQAIKAGRWGRDMISELAYLGSSGQHPQNYERDLHRWVRRQPWAALVPELYEFSLPVLGEGGIGAREVKHAALLPHELFASVHKAAPELFDYLFGDSETLRAWWRKAENTEWYATHPVAHAVPGAHPRVPVGLHGVDVGAFWIDKALVLTWGSVAVSLQTLDSRLLFCVVMMKHVLPDVTVHTLQRVLVWSLKALRVTMRAQSKPYQTTAKKQRQSACTITATTIEAKQRAANCRCQIM
jgi:hypothetical protein